MNPVTHFFTGWVVANTTRLNPRERAAVTISGVIPDVDGLGIIADFFTRNSEHPLNWWGDFHHVLGHNLGFALLVMVASFSLATRRRTTAFLAFLSFHFHLLGDLVGGRGPDGYQWPIPYLFPFSNAWQWTWEGQWALNAWPNFVVTGVVLSLTFYLAWMRGYSPLEIFSPKADKIFVGALRNRFPFPR